MAVPVVQSFTFNTAGAAVNSINLTKPSGVAVGDLLIMLVGNEDNTATTSFAAITGWTKAYEHGDATPDTKIGMYWRIADGTEGSTETIDWTATGTDFGGGWYLRITGHDPDSPIHIAGTAQQSAGATSLTSLSVTTTLDDCLVFSHMSGDGGDTYPFSSSGTGWPSSIPTNQELQDTTGTAAWAGAWVTRSLATAGASNNHTWGMNVSDGIVTKQFAVAPIQEGIQSVTPSEFDMDTASVTVAGLNFGATQGTGTVYLSDANTLAGSANEVEIANGVNTWSDTSINLDLTGLNATELSNLHTLGPGQRYVIVVTNATDEYGSAATTLHRPDAFEMSLSSNFAPGSTTQRLTGLTGTNAGGRIEEALNPSTTNTDVAVDGNREDAACMRATSKARPVLYDFRVLYGGNVPDTITQTPQVTVEDTASAALTTVAGTSAVGTAGIAISVALTGVLATGSVGNLSNDVTVGLSGVSSTAQVGSVGFEESGSVSPTGVQATSAEGSVTTSRTVSLSGNQGQGELGTTGVDVKISITGVGATVTIGSVGVNKSGSASITGVEGVSATGSVGFTEAGSVGLTGISATSEVGSLSVLVAGSASLTGVSATGAVDDVGVTHEAPITGAASVGALGSATPSTEVAFSGVSGSATAGSVTAAAAGGATLSGVSATSAVDSVGITKSGSLGLTGIEATASAGSVTAASDTTYGGTYNAVEAFPASSTVNISLYDPITGGAISLDDNTCLEIATGLYIWDTSKLTTQPSGYQEYAWSMTDSLTVKGGIINMFDSSDSANLTEVLAKMTELWQFRGLDASNPVTITPTTETAGSISLDITGDGETTSTATRT